MATRWRPLLTRLTAARTQSPRPQRCKSNTVCKSTFRQVTLELSELTVYEIVNQQIRPGKTPEILTAPTSFLSLAFWRMLGAVVVPNH